MKIQNNGIENISDETYFLLEKFIPEYIYNAAINLGLKPIVYKSGSGQSQRVQYRGLLFTKRKSSVLITHRTPEGEVIELRSPWLLFKLYQSMVNDSISLTDIGTHKKIFLRLLEGNPCPDSICMHPKINNAVEESFFFNGIKSVRSNGKYLTLDMNSDAENYIQINNKYLLTIIYQNL